MNLLSDNASIRTYLVGLSFECPMEGGNPEKCICHELRKKPVAERIRILASFSDEQRLDMFTGHRKCFREKIDLVYQKKICEQPSPGHTLNAIEGGMS
ncbi:MAG: hypothetical protein NTV93_11530 [Verrucomicrobia bacterium]|nr:hypothetical protein [Verrucomicrobiota bacterium]